MVTRIVRRYTKALYEEASQLGIQKEVNEDVTSLYNLLKSNRLLRNFFQSPILSKNKKQSVVKSLFEGKINKESLKFLLFLIEQSREDLIVPLFEDYIGYEKEMNNKLDVVVTSVVELDKDEKEKIIRSVTEYSKKEILPSFETDESLIGGFRINMGNYVIDASISHQLDVIKNKFKQVSL